MRVFALGGSGKVGLAAAQLLAQSDRVSEIAIVGRNLERAEEAAANVGEKAVAVRADGTDESALARLSAGYHIIMNSAFSDSVVPAIGAAVQSGAHYCDAATFGDAVEGVLQLASEAESAGITAVVATGISPCISSLMGVHVARQIEEVEQLQVGRGEVFNFRSGRELTPRQWLEDPNESLTALREFRPFLAWMLQRVQKEGIRPVLDFRQGRWVEADPTESGLAVPTELGGTTTAYPYFSGGDFWGQLPSDLSELSPVEVQFSPFPPQLHDLLREHARQVLAGKMDSETATDSFLESIEGDPHRWLRLPDGFVPVAKMWVRALGRHEGRMARRTCWFTAPMWDVGGYYLTSVAMAVAVQAILRGEVRERGVMHAETAFEPLSFFDNVIALLPEPPPDGRLIAESFEWLD